MLDQRLLCFLFVLRSQVIDSRRLFLRIKGRRQYIGAAYVMDILLVREKQRFEVGYYL